ncbi:MAG: hypothetical protein KGZ50_01430 [Peptococcaceae bacterium]|nr:hypothetical protein [Peptococcaceae bacterium]
MSAPNAPFFMFFRFFQASATTKAKNTAHVKYIGERPRVDKEPETPLPGEAHLRYLDERPRSHGLFGQDEAIPDITSVAQELKQHNSIVWRGILSLREDDAIKYGHTNRSKWEQTLRATLPDLGHKMGISSEHFRWFAAFHKEAGHPHVHLVFWDSSCQRQKGRLSADEMAHIRGSLLREIYGEERRRLLLEKTALRNLARQTVVDETQNPARVPEKNERMTLQNDIVRLSFALPRKGKTALAFMPASIKAETRRIAEWILRRPVFADQMARYLEIAGELAAHHSRQPEHIAAAKQNAADDLRDRVAQVVLKAAAQHRRASRARTVTVNAAAGVFLQTEDLLSRERRRLECEGAWLNISTRPRREEDGDTEVDNQKEVEKA